MCANQPYTLAFSVCTRFECTSTLSLKIDFSIAFVENSQILSISTNQKKTSDFTGEYAHQTDLTIVYVYLFYLPLDQVRTVCV